MTKPVEIQVAGLALLIEGISYTPGRPGRMYLRNGDPGDPPEPAELTWEAIRLDLPDCPDLSDLIETLNGFDMIAQKLEDLGIFEEKEDPRVYEDDPDWDWVWGEQA